MRFFGVLARPTARSVTNLLAVFASLWGYTMTPGLWFLFLAIAALGLINLAVGINDERQLKADRKLLEEMRDYMRSIVGPANIPAHFQDLSRLSNRQLRALTAATAQQIRDYAVTSGEGKYDGPWWKGLDTAAMSRDEARRAFEDHAHRTTEQHWGREKAFNQEMRPAATAVWQELKRRLDVSADELRKGHTLEHGGLNGPDPIEDCAAAIEMVARRLPTE